MEDLVTAYGGKRALVTGVTGFKGTWLAAWLHRLGARVTGLSLPPPTMPSLFDQAGLSDRIVDWREGDVRDGPFVRRVISDTEPDVVFHLAAQSLVRASYEDPVTTFSTNVMGTVELLEAVRVARRPVAVVVVTSDKCYENREQDAGYVEDDPLGGHDPYSASKGATEIVVSSYRRSFFDPRQFNTHGVALASGRAGNVIGPGDWAKDRIVPDAIQALRDGRAIPVRNPRSVRPWQHVLESISAYLALGSRLLGPDASTACTSFNFGPRGSDACPVADVVEAMIRSWGGGRWDDLSLDTAVHEARLLRLEIGKAHAVLGWTPTWSMDQAVAHAVAGYKAIVEGDAEVTRAMMNEQIGSFESAVAADASARAS